MLQQQFNCSVIPFNYRQAFSSNNRLCHCCFIFYFLIQAGGTVVESMDALFGLCRKKSAGSSIREPLNGTLFFLKQDDVDKFVSEYGQQKVKHGVNSVSFN